MTPTQPSRARHLLACGVIGTSLQRSRLPPSVFGQLVGLFRPPDQPVAPRHSSVPPRPGSTPDTGLCCPGYRTTRGQRRGTAPQGRPPVRDLTGTVEAGATLLRPGRKPAPPRWRPRPPSTGAPTNDANRTNTNSLSPTLTPPPRGQAARPPVHLKRRDLPPRIPTRLSRTHQPGWTRPSHQRSSRR